MLKCAICGKEYLNLGGHIKAKHNISGKEYLEKYGGVLYIMPDEIKEKLKISNHLAYIKNPKLREQCRTVSQNNWKDKNIRDKILSKSKSKYTKEVRQKMSKSYHDWDKDPTHIRWTVGKTKQNSEIVRKSALKRSKILKGRNKDNCEYMKKHSQFMKEWCSKHYKSPTSNFTEQQKIEWKSKISNTLTKGILNGKYKDYINNHFHTGYYESKSGDKYYYQSGLELDIMKELDCSGLVWSRCDFRIQYYKEDGTLSHYLPDFLIRMKNGENIILEGKGFPDEFLNLKIEAANKMYKRVYLCYDIDKDLKPLIKKLQDEEKSYG